MTITSDYSLTKLFVVKEINISVDSKYNFKMKVKRIRDFFEDTSWNGVYHLWTLTVSKWKEMLKIELNSEFDYIKFIIFELGKYRQYADIADSFVKYLQQIFPNIRFEYAKKNQGIYINDLSITSEIWDYVVYLLKLTCGEKVSQPQIFNSPEERAFYLKQQQMEEKIQNLRNKDKKIDKEGTLKALLTIVYSFPSLTFDYLINQTMAQIHWLQEMAAGEVSYAFNAKAYAAGNVKKGAKKLEFFIK